MDEPGATPKPVRRRRKPRIGLALAGGGVEGAIYEIGAVRALEEALEGVSFNELDVYVGVSAGAVINSFLASGYTTDDLMGFMLDDRETHFSFSPETFFRPAWKEMLRRGMMTPQLTVEALMNFARNPRDLTLLRSFVRLARALPVALFDNEPIREFMHELLTHDGRCDDFRKLGRKLVVVAAELDTGRSVRFGEEGNDHVPISRAVQASTALPGLYVPVLIDGRHHVDGVLLKTVHASVALEAGAELLICVNPIVPVDTRDSVRAGVMRRGKLIHRGLPTVLSQTFRTLVHSRLGVGLASYKPRFPGQDVLLFEPDRDDYRMFFTNIFSFAARRTVCNHAYVRTRKQLRERRAELDPILARHDLRLSDEVLADESRDQRPPEMVRPAGNSRPTEPTGSVTRRLDHTLDRLESLLEREAG